MCKLLFIDEVFVISGHIYEITASIVMPHAALLCHDAYCLFPVLPWHHCWCHSSVMSWCPLFASIVAMTSLLMSQLCDVMMPIVCFKCCHDIIVDVTALWCHNAHCLLLLLPWHCWCHRSVMSWCPLFAASVAMTSLLMSYQQQKAHRNRWQTPVV